MKKVSCKDISPDSTCNFEATGKTEKDVVRMMFDHVKSDHSNDVTGMSDADIRTMIAAKVHD